MKSSMSKVLVLLALGTTAFSFSSRFGGEGFEIYVNGKVVMQQFGKDINKVKNLQFEKITAGDRVTVKYHHCGTVGKDRVISIRDKQNKIVKEWRFANETTPVAAMDLDARDILAASKGNTAPLKLYYRSAEIPGGRLLTNIIVKQASVAKM